MNIERMIEAQRDLDDHIIMAKGLRNADLFKRSVIGLHVELAEMANAARWFKYWSVDQSPKTGGSVAMPCKHCRTAGKQPPAYTETCLTCNGEGYVVEDRSDELLEEYVDALHMFLSIGIMRGWEKSLKINLVPQEATADDITDIYLETIGFVAACTRDEWTEPLYNSAMKDELLFRSAWVQFLVMGIHYFGYSGEEIEAAYYLKNAENHRRQERDY